MTARGGPVAEPVSVAVLAWRQAGGLAESTAERGRVAVADVPADLIDDVACRFEQAHRVLDAGMPDVGLRPAAGGGREAAGQGALAEARPAGGGPCPERVAPTPVECLVL